MIDVESLLEQLDEDQREAVTHGEGPLLVVAGAGSGKTRVLTFRIAYLLASRQAGSGEILAVTFTNKAAREMTERVEALVGGPPAGSFVGTFHRFALQLLRRHPREVGLPERFAIADGDDQRRILERLLKERGLGSSRLTPRLLRARISASKNALLTPEQLASRGGSGEHELIAELYEAYQAELVRVAAVDFDDMLVLAVRLLEDEAAVRKGLNLRFPWILVDEYQDTNVAQARLLALLGGPRPNLTVVGDEDQSIYRWRGAEVDNILRFDSTYPGARVVTLGRNYRSAEPILRAAAALIANNARRRPKKLQSRAGSGPPVQLFHALDDGDEARFVVAEIERLRDETPIGEVAVLFRINAQSRQLEGELVRRGVSYEVIGGVRFWERAEIKDALAYLRLLAAPQDTLAFRRAVQVPARGIGQATMEVLERAAGEWRVSLPEAARRSPDGLTRRARLSLQSFFSLLQEVSEVVDGPGQAVARLLELSGLLGMYESGDEEDRNRRANLDQLVAAAEEAGERGLDLAGFVDETALLTDADMGRGTGGVHLSTLHAAKGLEFDVVFLVGMEAGLLPLQREGENDPEQLEEERRLAYVGMTRARRRLILTAARSRRLHGQLLQAQPSPFLLEVAGENLEDRTAAAGRDPFRMHLPQPAFRPGSRRGGPAVPSQGNGTSRGAMAGSSRQASASRDGWRPGLKVRHSSFGSGVVLQVHGDGAQTRLVVYFDRAGRKTLIPTLAKLTVG